MNEHVPRATRIQSSWLLVVKGLAMKPCRVIVLIGLFVWTIHDGIDSFADDGLQVRVRYRALGVSESPTATPPVIEKTVAP